MHDCPKLPVALCSPLCPGGTSVAGSVPGVSAPLSPAVSNIVSAMHRLYAAKKAGLPFKRLRREDSIDIAQRLEGLNDADTAPQTAARMEGHENAAFLGKHSAVSYACGGFLEGNGFGNGPARKFEQRPAIGFRKERHPRTFCGSPSYAASAAA